MTYQPFVNFNLTLLSPIILLLALCLQANQMKTNRFICKNTFLLFALSHVVLLVDHNASRMESTLNIISIIVSLYIAIYA
jgi:hypothetical protein